MRRPGAWLAVAAVLLQLRQGCLHWPRRVATGRTTTEPFLAVLSLECFE